MIEIVAAALIPVLVAYADWNPLKVSLRRWD
jgi:hypothetical protein